MRFGGNDIVEQNKAHRADLTWAKIGRSEYMRSDGVSICKDTNRAWWRIYLPDGRPACAVGYEGKSYPWQAAESSLTWAKIAATRITAETPAYERLR